MPGRVAITGATGFLGRHVTHAFLDAGWQVRILTRQDPVVVFGNAARFEVVIGHLGDHAALRQLCAGADCVVHVAGLVKARRDADFHRVNVDGSLAVARAVSAVSPSALTILVSSLAAREPGLSPYAASKRDAEEALRTHLKERLTIVRPTAIYGPGDQETFQFIAVAQKGWPLPLLGETARLTMIHSADVAQEIVALAGQAPAPLPLALCDDRPGGYGWREVMTEAAVAVNVKPRFLRISPNILKLAGLGGALARRLGQETIVTPGKARELLHPDWSIAPAERSTSGHVPIFTLRKGFADTVAWAREAGWLPRVST